MIKIRIRNDDHEIDLQFPISENKLYAKLAEIHAIEGKDAPQSAFVTEVYWPEELSMLKDRFANLDELNYLARRMESFDYQMQTRNIRKQINELKLQRQDSYESKILETLVKIKKIKALLDEIDEPLEEFDQKLFEQIVCEITISRNDELTITLIGGLKFTEII